jgi:demethylmenaquinone methyltransferase/2-methoxy-6-polyprenyl-1,4-benzoquinol methylase
MSDDQQMQAYYRQRASVYDRVYAYPERQAGLRYLEGLIPDLLGGRDVLEVAAGTGYWTQFLARTAKSVVASDASTEPLEVLEARNLPTHVRCTVQDAYNLADLGDNFSAAFAGLWFSHVPIERRVDWLGQLHHCLSPAARVVLLDNSRTQCERLPIVATDQFGNSYQDRLTDDGQTYRVIKNFPTSDELIDLTRDCGSHRYIERDHFWLFTYVVG